MIDEEEVTNLNILNRIRNWLNIKVIRITTLNISMSSIQKLGKIFVKYSTTAMKTIKTLLIFFTETINYILMNVLVDILLLKFKCGQSMPWLYGA